MPGPIDPQDGVIEATEHSRVRRVRREAFTFQPLGRQRLLRGSRHAVATTLAALLERGADVAITEVIAMELLAGARPGEALRELRSRLVAFPILPLEGLADFEEAALLFRSCRAAGETIRSLSDCLIAVPTIRAGAALLYADSDFDAISRHSALRPHPTGV